MKKGRWIEAGLLSHSIEALKRKGVWNPAIADVGAVFDDNYGSRGIEKRSPVPEGSVLKCSRQVVQRVGRHDSVERADIGNRRHVDEDGRECRGRKSGGHGAFKISEGRCVPIDRVDLGLITHDFTKCEGEGTISTTHVGPEPS